MKDFTFDASHEEDADNEYDIKQPCLCELEMLTLMQGEGTVLFRRNTLVNFCVANDISKGGVEILYL